jgi:hypothetical protein
MEPPQAPTVIDIAHVPLGIAMSRPTDQFPDYPAEISHQASSSSQDTSISDVSDPFAGIPHLEHVRTVGYDSDDDQPADPKVQFDPFVKPKSKYDLYTVQQKRKIVELAYPVDGPSKVRAMGRKYGVVHGTIVHWKKMLDSRLATPPFHPDCHLMDPQDLYHRSGYARLRHGVDRRSMHPGPNGKIPDWAQVHLLRYFDELRERQLQVGVRDLTAEYFTICPERCDGSSAEAVRQRVYRFMDRYGIVDRATTHQAQNKLHSQHIIVDFRQHIREIIETYDIVEGDIANFDQTNVSFECASKRTLSRKGVNSISCIATASSDRCTAMLGVSMGGEYLKPFIVFKAERKGRIQKVELVNLEGYAPNQAYTVQHNAWMDEEGMHEWIEAIWKPFALSPKRKGLCLLMLDEFKAHMVSSVVRKLANLNTIVEFIPPGYTSKCQVMDVGVNRPFKLRVGNEYNDFIRDWNTNNLPGTPIRPRRHDVSWWIHRSWTDLAPSIIKKTWIHCGFADAPPTSKEEEEEILRILSAIPDDDEVIPVPDLPAIPPIDDGEEL